MLPDTANITWLVQVISFNMYMCGCVHRCAGTHRGQKRLQNLLYLEFQGGCELPDMVARHPTSVLCQRMGLTCEGCLCLYLLWTLWIPNLDFFDILKDFKIMFSLLDILWYLSKPGLKILQKMINFGDVLHWWWCSGIIGIPPSLTRNLRNRIHHPGINPHTQDQSLLYFKCPSCPGPFGLLVSSVSISTEDCAWLLGLV